MIQVYVLKYIFNVRVRFPPAKARLLVATDHSVHKRTSHVLQVPVQFLDQLSSDLTLLINQKLNIHKYNA